MRARLRLFSSAVAFSLIAVSNSPVPADTAGIQFEEVTDSAGITDVGASWGSAWGDFNGDGSPDVWLVNHQNAPSLYLNQGDGTFINIVSQVVLSEFFWGDAHGAVWADFDNDGDQDLYQLEDEGDGPIPDYFFENTNGLLEEKGAELGLAFQLGRGRMPLWLDYDRDGLLDVFHPTTRRGDGSDEPTALFHQSPAGSFADAAGAVGLTPNEMNGSNFALLSDLSGDGSFELITHLTSGFPIDVYDMTAVPFTDIRSTLGIPTTSYPVFDAVAADLDGDLDNDLFLVRGEKEQDFVQIDSKTIEAHLEGSLSETGLSFKSLGLLRFDVYPKFSWSPEDIYIGSTGYHPYDLDFALLPNSTTWGVLEHDPGVDTGLYISYDPSTGTWEIVRSVGKTNLVIESSADITETAAIGWDPATPPDDDRLLINLGNQFTDQTQSAGIVAPTSGRNVVAADFDNDMDLDLYIVCTGPVENLPNLLYQNQGSGNFSPVANAGGAEGTALGRGDAVTAADYDSDGFLDLLVTNGVSKSPFELDGPTELFRNIGNSNHWIEIDLVGVQSNRDGIGARLLATAGGEVQLREQAGGIHYRGQNHQRIHFGLGGNTHVDELQVRWPSGIVQALYNIPADQIIEVTEPLITEAPEGEALPAAGRLIGCYPNPFNPTTTITFSLAQPERVRLSIHDAAGRLVNRLVEGELFPAGMSEVVWGGRNDSGDRVSSGVYFIRLESPSLLEMGKVVLLQ